MTGFWLLIVSECLCYNAITSRCYSVLCTSFWAVVTITSEKSSQNLIWNLEWFYLLDQTSYSMGDDNAKRGNLSSLSCWQAWFSMLVHSQFQMY